jgi:DNA repair protein RadC
MSIKQWQKDEKPREKLLEKGVSSLTDFELLAILIGSGTREKSAIDLAKELLSITENNLFLFGRLSVDEMTMIKGIGKAKSVTLAAAMELGRRQCSGDFEILQVKNSEDAAKIFIPLLRDLTHEEFWAAYLLNNNGVLSKEMIGRGSETASVVNVREIVRNALLKKTVKVIVAHNHPSGNIQPGEADINLTKKLKKALGFFDIDLLDHIIVGGNNYFSFADNNLI